MGAESGRYLVTGNLISKVFVIAGSIALARILFPEDYGYLVIAYLFDGIFNLFSISGYETYYIQSRDLNLEDDMKLLGACYWLRVRQSIVLFVLQLVLGIGIWHYNDPILGWMIGILSLTHIINIFGKPNEAYLSKNLNFKPVAISNFVRDIVGVVTKIAFALLGFGPISFVLGQIISLIPRAAILMRANKLNLQMQRKYSDIPKIMSFGRAVFFNTVGAYLTSQADAAMVATFYSKSSTGIYQFARKQSSMVFNFTLMPLNPLILSYVSKLKGTPELLIEKFKATGNMIMFIMIPLFIFAYVEIQDLVTFVFSQKWIDSVPIVRIFLIYYIFQFISYPSGFLPTALGHPAKKAKISFICFGFMVICLFILAFYKSALINYALVYVIGYMIKDIWVGVVGFNLLGAKSNYFTFLKDRLLLVGYLIVAGIMVVSIHLTGFYIVYKVIIFVFFQILLMLISIKYVYPQPLFYAIESLGGEKVLSKLNFLRNR